ncbi:hypothetical protein QTH87_00755 [Variovorax sp. J22P168]|uniref:hypothetical protein n=1 Tax=Variovorax jilinensis TaxID=3053513 RepID=UPI00257521DD|nr:hypothetical protein [Variovorax sp. J22P168]MDM0010954.1 hypothetical protein [Variovorax sp. J22P168]
MKQYMLTFLIAACAACSHVVAPLEAGLQQRTATDRTPAQPAPTLVLALGGRPW